MSFSSPLDLSEARARGLEVWPVNLSNWGNRGAGADAESIRFPAVGGIDAPVFGVAIAPWSLADGCVLSPNIQKQVATPAQPPGNIVTAQGEVVITKGSPWLGQLVAPFAIRALAEHYTGDAYLEPGESDARDWTPAFPNLALYLWLKRPTAAVLTGLRTPIFRRGALDLSAVDPDVETPLLAPLFVHGRRRARVTLRAAGTATGVTARVSATVGNFSEDIAGGGLINRVIETAPNLATSGALDPTALPHITMPLDSLDVTWLLVYATKTTAGTCLLTWDVHVYD